MPCEAMASLDSDCVHVLLLPSLRAHPEMVAKGMVGGLSSKGLSAAMRAAQQPKKNIASLYKKCTDK
jgi:hypothetical protein